MIKEGGRIIKGTRENNKRYEDEYKQDDGE